MLLKNLQQMFRAVQNRSKLFFSTRNFILISLKILMKYLKLNNDLESFIHVVRVLKGVEGGGTPLHIEMF